MCFKKHYCVKYAAAISVTTRNVAKDITLVGQGGYGNNSGEPNPERHMSLFFPYRINRLLRMLLILIRTNHPLQHLPEGFNPESYLKRWKAFIWMPTIPELFRNN